MYTNKINNKKYVGITKHTISKRYKSGYSGRFKNALNKYGLENFEVSIIKEFKDRKDACEYEKYIISKLNLNNDKYGYNIAKGGDGGNCTIGYTEEQKQAYSKKLSESRIGSKNPNYKKGLKGNKNGRALEIKIITQQKEILTFGTQKECREYFNLGLDMFNRFKKEGIFIIPKSTNIKYKEKYKHLEGMLIIK